MSDATKGAVFAAVSITTIWLVIGSLIRPEFFGVLL